VGKNLHFGNDSKRVTKHFELSTNPKPAGKTI